MTQTIASYHDKQDPLRALDNSTQPKLQSAASTALTEDTFSYSNNSIDSTSSPYLPTVTWTNNQNMEALKSVYDQFIKYVPSPFVSDKSEKPTDKPSAPDESKKPTDKKLTHNEQVQKEFLIALNEFREKKGLGPIEPSKSCTTGAINNSKLGFNHNILPKSYLQDVAWVPGHGSKSPRDLARQLLRMWQGDAGHLRPLLTARATKGGIGISGDVITLNMA